MAGTSQPAGRDSGMSRDRCVLQDMARAMAEEPSVRAVWLDAREKRLSFAFHPQMDSAAGRHRLEEVATKHRPDVPQCAGDTWRVACEICELGTSRPMPPGIRLVAMPGTGVMLEKIEKEEPAHSWIWQQIPWPHLVVRSMPSAAEAEDPDGWKQELHAAVACGLCTAAGFWLRQVDSPAPWPVLCFAAAYLCGGWFPARDTWQLLRQRTLDVHFLMLAVAVGAAAIGHWWEGATLLFLFSLSAALEEMAMARTQREIASLFKAAPQEATVVETNGSEVRRPVESLVAGLTVRVRPGDQFPVDAEILSGESQADESNLTGESVPVDKKPGDTVFSGTLNLWGSVDCAVRRPASESSLAKIIKLIKQAQESKAPSQRFTDRFGTQYTWAVLGLSAVMFFVWWLAFDLPAFKNPAGGSSAFYRAMTLLVVASPCALVLSIPSAILAGIAAAARRGILFRGGAAIEKLAEIRRVALDKTGTLTTGDLTVESIQTQPPGDEESLLRMAATLAHSSTHPVSRAIVRYARQRGLTIGEADSFRSHAGAGVEGQVEGWPVKMGRRSFAGETVWTDSFPPPPAGFTETFVAGGTRRGRLLLRDEIREASAPLLRRLTKRGLKVTMLTGDREASARLVAGKLDLEEVHSELTPEAKVACIQAWEKAGEKVAMVGDGVNDAPSLAAAHVAVGMGLRGSDAVLEQADLILTQDRLEYFAVAHRLSQRARAIIRQNLAISLGMIVVLVAGSLTGHLPLTIGVLGHEGSTLVVVANSLRLFLSSTEES